MTRREFGAGAIAIATRTGGQDVNPYFGPLTVPAGAKRNSVFRVYRYTEQEIAQARIA
jgi:hypothetical protein